MKISSKEILRELKQLHYKLKSLNYKNQTFKKLYEKTNNDKVENDDLVILENGRNIFSKIPMGIIDFMADKGDLDKSIFNPETRTMSIRDYYGIIEVIHYLINIIEFDLTQAYLIG